MDATETALIAPVAPLDRIVGRHRAALDHSAAWGVPAHVTVLYPFVPPDQVTEATLDRLREAVADTMSFECRFDRVDWFGDDVVWLAPEPDKPFRALTEAVWRRFPDHPPYAGAHPDTVPHLTVGSTRVGDLAGLRQAAADLLPVLPATARIDRVWLVAGTDAPDSWRTLAEFALG